MPQLILTPWFAILVLSWVVFMTMIPPKLLSHLYPNEPTTTSTDTPKTDPWSWHWQ